MIIQWSSMKWLQLLSRLLNFPVLFSLKNSSISPGYLRSFTQKRSKLESQVVRELNKRSLSKIEESSKLLDNLIFPRWYSLWIFALISFLTYPDLTNNQSSRSKMLLDPPQFFLEICAIWLLKAFSLFSAVSARPTSRRQAVGVLQRVRVSPVPQVFRLTPGQLQGCQNG